MNVRNLSEPIAVETSIESLYVIYPTHAPYPVPFLSYGPSGFRYLHIIA